MNHYPHHIGDFNTATLHLTFVERALYRELLDLYYDTEKPLIADVQRLARRVRAATPEQVQALDAVLEEFFTLEDDGWHNSRCDSEIAKYQGQIEQASRAGKASAAKRLNSKPAGEAQPFDSGDNEQATGVERALNDRTTNQNQNQNQNQERDAGEPADVPDKPARTSRGGKTLKTYLAECREAGVKPIPDDHYVRGYIRDAGITEDMAAIAWVRFREDHTIGTRKAKRYDDWPAAFANSVKARWYRLWLVNPEGAANWTNDGLQAVRVAEAQQREAEVSA